MYHTDHNTPGISTYRNQPRPLTQVWRRDDGWEQREENPSAERVAYLEAAGYYLT